MNENLEYAEDWILEQLIKADFEEKRNRQSNLCKGKEKRLVQAIYVVY